MKIKSLTTYYREIIKYIKLVSIFYDRDEVPFIIKACRLKPISYDPKKLKLVNKWYDEYNCSLKFTKKNEPIILLNELKLNNEFLTDFYHGLDIYKIRKISKLVLIEFGIDEDNQQHWALSFLGMDNYIRSYYIYNDEIKKISPLYMGYFNLKKIFKNLDIKNYVKYKRKSCFVPCRKYETWLTCLPANASLTNDLNKYNLTISNIIKG